MRIISQNGKVDLPYECFGVEIDAINDTKIIAYAVNSDDDTIWKLAEYSTKEKSRKGYERVEGRMTGICQRNISQVASKEPYNSKGSVRKQAGGYAWEFEKEGEVM